MNVAVDMPRLTARSRLQRMAFQQGQAVSYMWVVAAPFGRAISRSAARPETGLDVA